MSTVLSHFGLAILWACLLGHVTILNLAIGLALSVAALRFARFESTPPTRVRPLQVVPFILFFIMELVLSGLRVARDVISLRLRVQPAIVRIPLRLRTDDQITLLANLVSLTPGSLSVDVSPDKKYLYVHSMYAENPDDLRREIRDTFERRVLELLP